MSALGIAMPSFLLFGAIFAPASGQASVPAVAVVFALDEDAATSAWQSLPGAEFLFGGDGLPQTYRALATAPQLAQMSADPGLLYAQADADVLVSRIKTNDPYFTTDDDEGDKQWYLPKIRMPQAWEFGTGSDDVTVAIIDTGIHSSHLEFNDGRVLAGYDATTSTNIPADSNSDDNGHGTAVAGVIGAMSGNGKGIAGINWEVGLIPVKALAADGTGKLSAVAAGIVWAAEQNADIINLSLGGNGFGKDQTLINSIIYAYKRGSVIISAAGNDLAENGVSLDSKPVYPICADSTDNMVIGVAATDINDQKASFSNYGVDCVDISAPGRKILTTAFLPSDPSDNILIYGSGTSLATPIVSGVAALLKANNPKLSNWEIRDILLQTTDNIDALNVTSCQGGSCNGYLGTGRINAQSALRPRPILEGGLVRESTNSEIYQVGGGVKRLVNPFAFRQRGFSPESVLNESNNQLSDYRTEDPVPPLDNTLVKAEGDPTVYFVLGGELHPLTGYVFQARKFKFSDIQEMPAGELTDFNVGEWYWPPDGTLLVGPDSGTVYLMQDGVKRPVSGFVFTQRRLSYGSIVKMSQNELRHVPNAPDKFWLTPLENSLLKPDAGEQVYLVVDGVLRPLSGPAFSARGLRFSDIRPAPAHELAVLQSGPPILK